MPGDVNFPLYEIVRSQEHKHSSNSYMMNERDYSNNNNSFHSHNIDNRHRDFFSILNLLADIFDEIGHVGELGEGRVFWGVMAS